MSGAFYSQDTCDKISNKASINGKWFRREFNTTSEWIHEFSYLTNIYIIISNICIISEKRRKWIKLDKFAGSVS